VLRCFADDNVTHIEGSLDPIRDAETVETELMLADLESLERRALHLVKRSRGGDREAKAQLEVVDAVIAVLDDGKPARDVVLRPEQQKILRNLQLLSVKPVLYIANVDEASAAAGSVESCRVAEYAAARGARSVVISAAIEAELAQLTDADEKREFLASLGIEEPGLARVIRAGYELLHLVTFFTAGPKEAHAWTVEQGTKAPQAAGKIHTDFEKGFIRAETIAYADFATNGGEQGARDAGRMRLEGADYVVQDGDVMRFRFNL
jgi:GTP-binding protein YchF